MKTNTKFLVSWYPRMISFIFLLMLFQSGFSLMCRDSVLEEIAVDVENDFFESQGKEVIIYPNPEFHTIFIDGIIPDSSLTLSNAFVISLFNDNLTDYVLSIDNTSWYMLPAS
ncbi:hypothetical protein [Aquimarina aggregata]|uniref:hypothetical protein n=1 Tax=Aquimarina aggregata TaxID=1642818 RepID=UPI002491C954|nr:hypothetical protein [Aquimarina aggregata]